MIHTEVLTQPCVTCGGGPVFLAFDMPENEEQVGEISIGCHHCGCVKVMRGSEAMSEVEYLDNTFFKLHGPLCARPQVFFVCRQEHPYRVHCPSCRFTCSFATLEELVRSAGLHDPRFPVVTKEEESLDV